ncbi:MAG: WXG100 family type VII secretion target [Chloroflexi bacterium]|nr:WXG100 family type VII secretion target [Chloroflexota bacterium]
MTSELLQVEYTGLVRIAQQFEHHAEAVNALQWRLTEHMDAMRDKSWIGDNASAFFGVMNSDVLPPIARLHSALRQASEAALAIHAIMMEAETQAAALMNGEGAPGGSASTGGSPSLDATATRGATARPKDGGLYDQNGNAFTGKPRQIFVPGISTQWDKDGDGVLEWISRMNGEPGNNFVGIYNQSDGELTKGELDDVTQALNDRLEARFGLRFGERNPAVLTLMAQISGAIEDGRPLEIAAHSQGGAITADALTQLSRVYTPQQLSLLTVKTYGSFGTAFPSGPQYTHYVIAGDPVPAIAGGIDVGTDRADAFVRNREFYENIVVLPPVSFDTHGMDSYIEAVEKREQFDEFIGDTVDNIGSTIGNFVGGAKDFAKDVFSFFGN